jgi:hypothetical protein
VASQRRPQSLAPAPQEPLGALDSEHRGQELPSSPWMTPRQAAAYLCFDGVDGVNSVYRFIRANGIPIVRRSRMRILIARADLDQALRGAGGARRRGVLRKAG